MKKVSITCQPSLLLNAGPEGTLQVKDVNGRGELYYVDTAGVAVQLTTLGVVNATVAGGGTGGVTDHGALTGLADDDHPQYGALAQAESVASVWSFTEGLKVVKEYALASRPAANSTNVDLVVKVYDTDGVRMLQWCAYNGSAYSWVTLGVAL